MQQDLADTMPLCKLLGIRVSHASLERVSGELVVRSDLCTSGNILHGGAIMAFADSLGAIAAYLNLPDGANGTTTIESKTNFLGPAREGATLQAETTPVKTGRRLSVWQTKIKTMDEKAVALVTQTQLVL